MSTYVISDIHGWWEKFEDFLAFIKPEDTIYVLGDVIDRGKDGIKILQYIMKNQDRFKMILGNHEHMMLDFLNSLDKEFDSPINYTYSRDKYTLWVLSNHGDVTLDAFEKLSQKEQQEIKRFLDNLPVAYQNVKVGENVFYLVHSMPGWNAFKYINIKGKDFLEQKDLGKKEILEYVWYRPVFPEEAYLDDRIVIGGHTIVMKWQWGNDLQVYFSKDKDDRIRYVDIDCGCAIGTEVSKLACLCLDDFSIHYF